MLLTIIGAVTVYVVGIVTGLLIGRKNKVGTELLVNKANEVIKKK